MPPPDASTLLFAVVGDIHGRFLRLERWLEALEQARGRQVNFVLAVGDVEAFESADDHRRKAAKRTLPAEFAEYAQGVRHFPRPLYFIGGNNEDFASLDGMPDGGTLAPNVHYLGRAGTVDREGLAIAYLSGIYAPRFIDAPLEPPTSAVKAKQAGYFRTSDLERLRGASRADLMLLHEWPRGLVRRVQGGLKLRAHRFPWIGNPVVREGVARIRPSWLFCGHSHVHWPPRSNFRKVASPAWPAWTRLPVRKEPCFG